MNFNGDFVEDGVTYDVLQVQFNKTTKKIKVQANKKDGSWVEWFSINGS